MQYVVLTTLLALAPYAGVQDVDNDGQRLDALYEFAGFVADAARDMQIPGKVGIGTTDDILDDDHDVPMAIGRVPEDDPLSKSVMFMLTIRNAYLLDYPAGGLAHGAAHEVCHVALGHEARQDD